MPSIDERIVSLIFDNSGFESKAQTSMDTLSKLDNNINAFGGSGSSAFKSVENSVDAVTKKFSAMSIAGIVFATRLSNQLYNIGTKFAKSLTIDQYTAGFGKYESSIKSVRTMMNQTGETLQEIEKVMSLALKYSDETSYDYSQISDLMTQFVGAGASVAEAEKMAEGVSNIGAYAGKASNEMAIVYRNFADVYTKGFLSANDYRSLNDIAHVLTPAFKEELIKSAEAYGYLEKKADGFYYTTKKLSDITGGKSGKQVSATNLKDSLQYQWAQRDVLADVLDKFTYNEGKSMDSLAYKAYQAAKEYRTFSDVVATVKDVTSTAISTTLKSIFGDAEEAVTLWTAVGEKMVEIFANPFVNLNDAIADWKSRGGRYYLLETLKVLWDNIENVLGRIRESFVSTFGFDTEELMFKFTTKLLDFADSLNIKDSTLDNITNFFSGLFNISKSIVKLAGKGFKAIINPILDFIGIKAGSFWESAGNLGTMLTNLSDSIEKSETLATVLESVSGLISGILTNIDNLINKVTGAFDKLKGSAIGQYVSNLFGGFIDFLKGLKTFGDFLKNDIVGANVSGNLMTGMAFLPSVVGIFLAALLGRNGISGLMKELSGEGGNLKTKKAAFDKILDSAKLVLGKVKSFVAWFNTEFKGVKTTDLVYVTADKIANIMTNMGKAILMLAIGLTLIGGLYNSGTLYASIGALSSILTLFIVFLAIVKKYTSKLAVGSHMANLIKISAPLVAIAGAALLLSAALALLSLVDTGKLITGAAVLTVVMTALTLIAIALSKFASSKSTFNSVKNKGLFGAKAVSKESNYSVMGVAFAVFMIAAAAAVLSAALAVMSVAAYGKLITGAGVLVGVLAVVALIAYYLTKYEPISNGFGSGVKQNVGSLIKMITGLLGLAAVVAAIVVIAGVLTALSVLPTSGLLVGTTCLLLCLAIAAVVMQAIYADASLGMNWSKIANSGLFLVGLAGLAGIAFLFATSLAVVSVFDPKKIIAAAGTMVAVIVAMGWVLAIISNLVDPFMNWSKIGNVALSLAGIAALAGIMFIIATSLSVLSLTNPTGILAGAFAMVGVLAAMALITFGLSKIKFNNGAGWIKAIFTIGALAGALLVISFAVGSFAKAMSSLTGYDANSLLAAGGIILAFVGIMGIIFAGLGALFAEMKGAEIFKMVTSMLAFAIFGAALTKMVQGLVAAMRGLQSILSSTTGVGAILGVVGMIIGLAFAIKILLDALAASGASAPAILSVSGALLTFGLSCLVVAGAVLLIVGSIAALFGMLYLLSAAIMKLGDQGDGLINTIQRGLKALKMLVYDGIYVLVFSFLGGLFQAIGDAAPVIGEAVYMLFTAVIASAIAGLVTGLIGGIALAFKYAKLAIEAGKGNISWDDVYATYKEDFGVDYKKYNYQLGKDSVDAFTEGVADGAAENKDTFSEIINDNLFGGESIIPDNAATEVKDQVISDIFGGADESLNKAVAGLAYDMMGGDEFLTGIYSGGLGDVTRQFSDYDLYSDALPLNFSKMAESWVAAEEMNLDTTATIPVAVEIEPKLSTGAASGALNAPALSAALANIARGDAQIISDNYNAGLSTMEEGAATSAQNTITGALSVLISNVANFAMAGYMAGSAYVAGYNSALDIHSPSRVMEKAGMNTTKGAVKGLDFGMKEVEKQSKILTKSLSDPLKDNSSGGTGNETIDKIIGKLEERFGGYVNDLTGKVNDAAGQITGSASGSGSSGSKAPTVTNSQLDEYKKNGWTIVRNSDGTLTAWSPVNNLTSAESSQYSVDLGYLATPGRGKKQSFDYGSYNDQGGSYSFVQNNYSPKSLSRIEIYRQTQNQFNNWKAGSSYRYD